MICDLIKTHFRVGLCVILLRYWHYSPDGFINQSFLSVYLVVRQRLYFFNYLTPSPLYFIYFYNNMFDSIRFFFLYIDEFDGLIGQLTYYQSSGFGDTPQEYSTYNSTAYSYIRRVPDFAEHCPTAVGFYPDQNCVVSVNNYPAADQISAGGGVGEYYATYDVGSSSSSTTSYGDINDPNRKYFRNLWLPCSNHSKWLALPANWTHSHSFNIQKNSYYKQNLVKN